MDRIFCKEEGEGERDGEDVGGVSCRYGIFVSVRQGNEVKKESCVDPWWSVGL